MLSPPSPAQEPVEPIGDADAGADEEPEEDSEDGGSGSGSENEDSVVQGGVEDVPPKDSPRPTSQPLFPTSPSIPPTELEFSPPKNEVIEIKDTPMKAEPETMDVVDASEVPNPKPEWMTACHEIHVGTGKSILKQQQRTTLRERNLQ